MELVVGGAGKERSTGLAMIIAVVNGKGGTGKTSVAVNLAISMRDIQLLDCDVEGPNAHIFLKPRIIRQEPVYRLVLSIKEERCDYCGKCAALCQYHAILVAPKKVLVFPELCRGCGACILACPQGAIVEGRSKIGTVKEGYSDDLRIVFGELEVGEPMASPLIREVKRRMDESRDAILDAPPGLVAQ